MLSFFFRFFDLMVFLKYWARVHDFCSSSKLSSFSLCMLALSFLLSLKNEGGDRVIPTVDELLNKGAPSGSDIFINDWKCSFDNTPTKVALPDSPNYSFLGLLKGFFEYMGTVPFQTDVLSVSIGGLIPRELFNCPDELPNAYACYKNFISKHPAEVLLKVWIISSVVSLQHGCSFSLPLYLMQYFLFCFSLNTML